MAVINVKNVSKLYGFGDATVVALDEVDLSVERGEFVAVMGPSGCGKSTLMHIIGLLDRPTHGRYLLHGQHVGNLRGQKAVKTRRDAIGFVFQSFNLLPRLNVLENVALPLTYKGISQTRRTKMASNMLERVGLNDREYYLPGQLSGGQVQRVAIARALINNPSIIIADEPTGNLDSASSILVMELLREIHESGNTVLMVTHNPDLTRYASRVLYMHDGVIVHDEMTKIGEVAKTARKSIVSIPKKSEEDDLAGVSALIKAIPKAGDNRSIRRRNKRVVTKKGRPTKRRKRAVKLVKRGSKR